MNRRDLLKSLATVPVLGAVLYGWHQKKQAETLLKKAMTNEISLNAYNPIIEKDVTGGKKLRIGIIGSGGRGIAILKAAGFIEPETIDDWKAKAIENEEDKRYEEYLEQSDLNLELVAVCDIFDIHAEKAIKAGANINREGLSGKMGNAPKRFKTYQELLAADNIDGVIIATPDHWHGTLTIAAAKAGKHVYCEKPMTWTVHGYMTFTLMQTKKPLTGNSLLDLHLIMNSV